MSQLSHEYPDEPERWAPARHPADWGFPDEFVAALTREALEEDAADDEAHEWWEQHAEDKPDPEYRA